MLCLIFITLIKKNIYCLSDGIPTILYAKLNVDNCLYTTP